jgi:hypothetical protein
VSGSGLTDPYSESSGKPGVVDKVEGVDLGEEERVESASAASAERVMEPLTVEARADSRAARV